MPISEFVKLFEQGDARAEKRLLLSGRAKLLHGQRVRPDAPATEGTKLGIMEATPPTLRLGIEQTIWGGRQHYLRWNAPATWRNYAFYTNGAIQPQIPKILAVFDSDSSLKRRNPSPRRSTF